MTLRHKYKIIISCEHGGNHVPPEYRALFRGRRSVLQSHRGWDRGALELARELSSGLHVQGSEPMLRPRIPGALLFFSETTRLLVDLNRSLHHRQLFSEFTRGCDREVKEQILAGHYHPYRKKVEDTVRQSISAGCLVMHFSVHSFTPHLDGEIRRTDIGLLYDPQRAGERSLCHALRAALGEIDNRFITRLNYPYRGTADGFTTYLRKKYGGSQYLGVEIEINQKHVTGDRTQWRRLRRQSLTAMQLTLENGRLKIRA